MNSVTQLREELEQDIVSGVLSPGDRLDESVLAERFSVSRTPVREALQRLATSGFVELRPRRGAFVREISLAEMIEMFEVMAELEGMCARLAARRITPEESVQLQTALEACSGAAQSGDPDAYYHANAEFHSVIYDAAHNSFLAEQARSLHLRLAPYRRLQLRVQHRMHQSLREHTELTKHLVEGDSVAAEHVLKAHVAIQGEKFSDIATAFPR